MTGDDTVPVAEAGAAIDSLAERARAILDAHWQPEGYTVPNRAVYPHQWLWDSCFHAIVWAHLGEPERAHIELGNVFARQADDGFVPHMTYWRAPDLHADFWGRRGSSSITQPPMYGHAIAELARRGIPIGAELLERAQAGLEFLMARRDRAGLVAIVHPWESGCDDSPRWDSWYPGGWDRADGRQRKGELVAAIRLDPVSRSPIGSDRFEVTSAAFNALASFNAFELSEVLDRHGDDGAATALRQRATAIAGVLRARWDEARQTFVDGGSHDSARVRTLEALLPVLVGAPDDAHNIVAAVFGAGGPGLLRDPSAFGGPTGPAQVHRQEPAFDPEVYWRGPAWPQLTYLFWVAARRLGRDEAATELRDATVRGAVRSGFAEYWHPDTGVGFGAAPQSWTALAAVMAADPVDAPAGWPAD